MEIVLTLVQWSYLKLLVAHGSAAERSLNKPVEVKNNAASIEIEDSGVTILLPD